MLLISTEYNNSSKVLLFTSSKLGHNNETVQQNMNLQKFLAYKESYFLVLLKLYEDYLLDTIKVR